MTSVATYCMLVAVMLAGAAEAAASNAKHSHLRLETMLEQDSTVFTMTIPRQSSLHAGKLFTVRIHVALRPGWHIFSSALDPDCLCGPLELSIPAQLTPTFEIVKFQESGKLKTWYDSTFLDTMRAHFTPFDIVARVRVLKGNEGWVPFRMLVHYMAVDSNQCWPPRWFEVPMTVLGKKPLELRIAESIRSVGNYMKCSLATGSILPVPHGLGMELG